MRDMYTGFKDNTTAITRNAAVAMMRQALARLLKTELAACLHLWLATMQQDARLDAEGEDLMFALGLGASHNTEVHELEAETAMLLQSKGIILLKQAKARLMRGAAQGAVQVWRGGMTAERAALEKQRRALARIVLREAMKQTMGGERTRCG